MEMTIRNMTEQDLPKAIQIFYDAFNAVGEDWTIETCTNRINQYFDPQTCWVAEADSRIIGISICKEDNGIHGKELYVDILAVDPAVQKSGAGRLLLQTAEEYAKDKGLVGVWLLAGMSLTSYDWYIRDGYKEAKWRVVYKSF